MGDRKSSSSSSKKGERSTKSSKEKSNERAHVSQRYQSDPAATSMARSFSASHAEPGSTRDGRSSKESLDDAAASDYYDDEKTYKDEEKEQEEKPSVTKRHSSSNHMNVYTECGRHSDDWLFGGIKDAVKSMLGKNEKK